MQQRQQQRQCQRGARTVLPVGPPLSMLAPGGRDGAARAINALRHPGDAVVSASINGNVAGRGEEWQALAATAVEQLQEEYQDLTAILGPDGFKKGPWTAHEDAILSAYVKQVTHW